MDRFDRYWIGILVGLLLPAAFGLTYIEVMNLWYPLQTLQFHAGGVLSKLLLVSVFPDLALIFVFYTTDTWRLSKGILAGAMPYILVLQLSRRQVQRLRQNEYARTPRAYFLYKLGRSAASLTRRTRSLP